MEFIDFNEIATYFQKKIEMITYNLQENKQIAEDEIDKYDQSIVKKAFDFVFFVNKGDYHTAVQTATTNKEKKSPPIPVLIKNGGGLQDSSTSIPVYLQKIELEVYGWADRLDNYKDQWHDVELILSKLCLELKGKTDTLMGNTIKLDMSDYPVFTELENKHFIALLNCNMHIMQSAHLSNLDKIKINGVEIPYMNFTEDFTTELISDNKITTEIKYMPNIYIYQLGINGLYVSDNSVVNLLVEGCTTGDLYAQPFNIEITRNDNILATRIMYVKNFQTIRSFGSIVAYKVSFYPAYVGD